MRKRNEIPRRLLAAGSACALLAAALLGAVGASAAGPVAVPLSTAASFAVLAGSGITNTGATVTTGDIGSFPTTTIGGFPPGTVGGTNHAGDAVTQGAKTALTTAYLDAESRTPVTTVPTELGGTILTAGVYTAASGTFGLTGSLTLDGQGDPSAVFIFQMPTTLTTATGSNVTLTGSAQSCNVFWQVGSSATLGGATTFRGTILALTSITLVTGATIDGRALARNGAVTLDTNTITISTCAAPPPPPQPMCCSSGTTPGPATPAPLVGTTPLPLPSPSPSILPAVLPTVAPFLAVTAPAPLASPTVGPAAMPLALLPFTGTDGPSDQFGWSISLLLGALALLAVWIRARSRHSDTAGS